MMFKENTPEKITTSSGKGLVSTIEHMQVLNGRDQVSGGVSVSCQGKYIVRGLNARPLVPEAGALSTTLTGLTTTFRPSWLKGT